MKCYPDALFTEHGMSSTSLESCGTSTLCAPSGVRTSHPDCIFAGTLVQNILRVFKITTVGPSKTSIMSTHPTAGEAAEHFECGYPEIPRKTRGWFSLASISAISILSDKDSKPERPPKPVGPTRPTTQAAFAEWKEGSLPRFRKFW